MEYNKYLDHYDEVYYNYSRKGGKEIFVPITGAYLLFANYMYQQDIVGVQDMYEKAQKDYFLEKFLHGRHDYIYMLGTVGPDKQFIDYILDLEPDPDKRLKPITRRKTIMNYDGTKRLKRLFSVYIRTVFSSFFREVPFLCGDKSPRWDLEDKLFISIPKTGTLSINAMISQYYDLSHLFSSDLPEKTHGKLKTIVRNPYTRLLSAFMFLKRGGFNHNSVYTQYQNMDFEEFVLNHLDKSFTSFGEGYDYAFEMFFKQTYYLVDSKGKLNLRPENIGRFENFAEDVERLFSHEGKIPHCNKSTYEKPFQEYYQNMWVRLKVRALYRDDFKFLGYSEHIDQLEPIREIAQSI